MNEIVIKGLHKVKKDESGKVIPEEYDKMWEFGTYLCQNGKGLYVGHWDKSMIACEYDSRGSFSDGIMGHFKLDDIDAYLLLEGDGFKYEIDVENDEETVFLEKCYL